MNDFQHELLFAAPVSKVYEAITTLRGLQSWWTMTCDVSTSVGERSTFRFGQTYKVMQLEALRPDTEVRWRCVDAHLHLPGVLSRTNEWKGTVIVFRLEAQSSSSTRFSVEHIGLTPQIECYDICTQGWVQFLGSLKQYVETGKGAPYVDGAV